MESSGKSEILRRIAVAGVRPGEPLVRAQVSAGGRTKAEIVDQFAEYAEEYRAHVVRVSAENLGAAIDELLRNRGSERIVVPADLPSEMTPPSAVRDDAFDHRVLAGMQAVITTCATAIAETGTIVLDAGAGQGRRALTLIPDHHICVVFEEQVVDSVPEAVAVVADSVRQGRPLTWISGPSATSDIELSRVEGVHGPRILDVLVVSTLAAA